VNQFDIQITLGTWRGDRKLYMANWGLLEDSTYCIIGCVDQTLIHDERDIGSLVENEKVLYDIIPGTRLVARALQKSLEHRKFDYVALEGLVKRIELIYRG
jgi:hypothetical protein